METCAFSRRRALPAVCSPGAPGVQIERPTAYLLAGAWSVSRSLGVTCLEQITWAEHRTRPGSRVLRSRAPFAAGHFSRRSCLISAAISAQRGVARCTCCGAAAASAKAVSCRIQRFRTVSRRPNSGAIFEGSTPAALTRFTASRLNVSGNAAMTTAHQTTSLSSFSQAGVY